jgi:hypothetical protein
MRGLVIRGRRFAVADVVMSGAGVAMLVNSLLPWYGYDASGWHPTYDGFQSGFLAFFPLLIVVLIAGTSATRAWSGTELGTIGATSLRWDAVFLLADALAFLLVVLFWATLPSLIGVSTGVKIGTLVALLVIGVQATGALMALVKTLVQKGDIRAWRPRRAEPSLTD